MADGIRRRRLLAKAKVLGAAVLAGCSSGGGSSDDDSTADPRGGTSDDSTTDSGNSGTDGGDDTSDSGPSDEELLAQTHAATQVETVVQQLDLDSVTLNFNPADSDAGYADSVVFSEFSASGDGVLDVELDLGQAIQQRHHGNLAAQNQHVQEYVDNIEDPEWRQQILEEDPTIEDIDWEIYTNDSLSYGERMRQSMMWGLWYVFEESRFGGVSSTHNQYKAQALQGAERVACFDTFVWDYGIPGHGLVSAIENQTRSDDGTAQQETYIVETSFAEGQQVVTWDNSQYSESGLHPAREDVGDREEGFYGLTGIGKDEADLYEPVDVPMSGAEAFIEFFRNPESSPPTTTWTRSLQQPTSPKKTS